MNKRDMENIFKRFGYDENEIEIIKGKLKFDCLVTEILEIANYDYNYLIKLELFQLESIRELLLAGFSKKEIEEKKLYNLGHSALNLIKLSKPFNKFEELNEDE